MIFLWLSLIIVLLLIIQINNHHKKLRAFLIACGVTTKLFDVCAKYKLPTKVEVSIKVKPDGEQITDRYTIPYHISKMPIDTIEAILREMKVSEERTREVVNFIDANIRPDSDIIFGIDRGNLKVYTDDGMGTLNLISVGTGEKFSYDKVPVALGHKFADSLSPDIRGDIKWDLVLEKRDDGGKILNYHNRLKYPLNVQSIPSLGVGWRNTYVHWISISPDGSVTYYIRPTFWYDALFYMI